MSELNNQEEKKSGEVASDVASGSASGRTSASAETVQIETTEVIGGSAVPKPLVARDDFARAATTASQNEESPAATKEKSTPSQKRPFTHGQKIGVCAVAILSIAAIAVSAAFLFNPATPESVSEQESATHVDDDAAAAAVEQDATAQAQAPTEAEGAGERQAPSSDELSVSSQQPAPPTPAPDSAQDNSTNAPSAPSGGSGSSGGVVAPPASAPTPAPTPTPTPAPATVTVSVSIDSSSVGSPVSGGTTATLAEGATAYDALMACGVSVNASNSAYGIYISSIGGLAEKEHGGTSGWHYAVNGSTPGVSCSSYTLSDGDTVRWFYSA